MTQDQSMDVVWYVLVLILVGSALAVHKLPVATMVKYALAWIAIGAVLFLIVDQRDKIVELAGRVGIGDQQMHGDTIRIRRANDGHFWARVKINGTTHRMLIDSGATTTSLSQATAKAAGVAVDDSGYPVLIDTANGTTMARRGVVKTLAIGNLTADNLNVLVSPSFGDLDVIGMNFLSRLGSWRAEGSILVLSPNKTAWKGQRPPFGITTHLT